MRGIVHPGLAKLLVLAIFLKSGTALCQQPQASASAPNPHEGLDVDDRFEDSVVRLNVSKQAFDSGSPWQKSESVQHLHHGVVLDKNRILTTAYAIADASFIEMSQFGEPQRHPLRVAFADYEANLAVLEAIDPGRAFKGLKPVVLGDDMKINDKVNIYKSRDAYQMARLPASLQEVGIYVAVTSSYSLVSYLLKVQQSGLGWSEPVFQGARFVALCTGQDNNFVYAMPAAVIKHFLEDEHGAGYKGFPAIGVELDPLVSPEMRSLLKAPAGGKGLRIAEVGKDSAFFDILHSDDVLLEVGGVPVSEHGFFTHPRWGKLHLKFLLNQRYGGDSLGLKILRDGKTMEVSAKLSRFDSNRAPIYASLYDQAEPHLIFGGLVFQELSKGFLRQWGREWQDVAPLHLLQRYNFKNAATGDPQKRVVILARVLADEFNRGYGDISSGVVETVNGRIIANINDMKAALRDAPVSKDGRHYARFQLAPPHGEIILGYAEIERAHARIAKTYEISSKDSFFH